MNHKYEGTFPPDGSDAQPPTLSTCDANRHMYVTKNMEPQIVQPGEEIIFTYDITFQVCNLPQLHPGKPVSCQSAQIIVVVDDPPSHPSAMLKALPLMRRTKFFSQSPGQQCQRLPSNHVGSSSHHLSRAAHRRMHEHTYGCSVAGWRSIHWLFTQNCRSEA